jgi:hypothetical protein
MSKVISIHEYILKPGISERGFVKAILKAKGVACCACPVLWTTIWLKESEAFEMVYIQPFGSMKAKKRGKAYGDQ